jgi:hypothetical protein
VAGTGCISIRNLTAVLPARAGGGVADRVADADDRDRPVAH